MEDAHKLAARFRLKAYKTFKWVRALAILFV